MQRCRLVLQAKPYAYKKLMKMLKDKVTQTFSYAVAPQMQTQRIAMLNKHKQQLNILVSAALQGNDNKAEGLMEQLSSIETELEILERNPLVIGFGDWEYEEESKLSDAITPQMQSRLIDQLDKQKTKLDDLFKTVQQYDAYPLISTHEKVSIKLKQTPQMPTQEVIDLLNNQKEQLYELVKPLLQSGGDHTDLEKKWSALEEEMDKEMNILDDNELNTKTRFGWVIQPRLTADTTWSGNPVFRQLPGHYSLSAVISIPSWWRSVKLQVNKCWLTEPKLGATISSLCDNHSSKSPTFSVKVPANVHEINQKLKFAVLKSPSLTPDNYDDHHHQKIEVGRKGAILLEGLRLWRSTVVLLDNQKADSIEVLPDMKAVMATFQCVRPPAGDPEVAYPSEKKEDKQTDVNASSTNNTAKQSNERKKSADDVSSKNSKHTSDPNQQPDILEGQEGGESQKGSFGENFALARLWTSEGTTDYQPLKISLKPFVQRYPGEKPCYEIEAIEQARSQIK